MNNPTERLVEIEWVDTLSRHAWSTLDELPTQAWMIRSVGYVTQDNDEGIVIVEARASGDSEDAISKSYGCATFIPRSAIQKVTTLSRKRT